MAAVLSEREDTGHTEHFAPVRLRARAVPGTLLRARVTGADAAGLLADPVAEAA